MSFRNGRCWPLVSIPLFVAVLSTMDETMTKYTPDESQFYLPTFRFHRDHFHFAQYLKYIPTQCFD
jgi:hypothetical protein